jgi:hypothetical protein
MRVLTVTDHGFSMATEDDDGAVDNKGEVTATETSKKRKKTTTSKEDKAARKRARAAEKVRLLEQVPKVDEQTGIAYTKQQIRRMRKRVARGLHPIETPAEMHQRRMRESELKKEEEAEFAGLFVQKKRPDAARPTNDDDDEEEQSVKYSDDQINDGQDGSEKDEDGDQESTTSETGRKASTAGAVNEPAVKETAQEQTPAQPPAKKKPRCKPVPHDYVCSACQNAIQPAHWIYDCPQKKSVRGGVNKNEKQLRGVHDPSEKKLFVSGLPFEATVGYVKKLFESKSGIAPTFVKLVKFKDSERCRGQAYLSFASEADAKMAAQKMDGQDIIQSSTNPAATAKDGAENRPKKNLKLAVTSVRNRFVTSKKT